MLSGESALLKDGRQEYSLGHSTGSRSLESRETVHASSSRLQSSEPPKTSPPILTSLNTRSRALSRPGPIKRSSSQSLRTSASSSVQSIPEDGPLPPIGPQAYRRLSGLSSNQVRPIPVYIGPGNDGTSKQRGVRARGNMSREAIEMGVLGREQKGFGGTGMSSSSSGSATKEDLAMAKWRKWAVEQPNIHVNTIDISPTRSRKPSLATESPSPPSHLLQTFASSSSTPSPPSHSSPFPGTSSSLRNSSDSTSYQPRSSPRPNSASGLGRYHAQETSEIYLTDTMLALQDVELAVDEDAMLRAAAQNRKASRMLSSQPRLSAADNPFMDIADRLASRRIRPLVLELIHSLGHYIFTLWSTIHPDQSCPWVIPASENPLPPVLLRGWHSRTITAISEGKRQGFVPVTPSASVLTYWRAEVEYGLMDVTEAVGRWKKRGQVFSVALDEGEYGAVEDENVLSGAENMEGGNIARLLNDLEEALWGDALPRLTDLSYLLPADFDPYAPPSEDDLIVPPSGGQSSPLGHLLGPSAPVPTIPLSPGAGARSRAVMAEVSAMPDLLVPPSPSPSPNPSHLPQPSSGPSSSYKFPSRTDTTPGLGFTNQGVTAVWAQRARASISAQGGLSGLGSGKTAIDDKEGGDAHPGSRALSLEEIGKLRHAEWLASQRNDP